MAATRNTRRAPLTWALLTSAVWLSAAPAAHAQMYRCEIDGRTTFSDRPCATSAERVQVSPASGQYDRRNDFKAQINTLEQQREHLISDIQRDRANRETRQRIDAEKAAKDARCRQIARQRSDAEYWSAEFRHPDNIRREQDKAKAARTRDFFECGNT